MVKVEVVNNIDRTLKDDLSQEIQKDSKLSIATASFSIYAYDQLKKELESID